MAGHAQQWVHQMTVDYKGGEHSKLIHSEFHHITSAVLIGGRECGRHSRPLLFSFFLSYREMLPP